MRWLLLVVAALCLVLAVVPMLPALPLLVAAAWAAARSSPRLHAWLLSHQRFGPWLRDWDEARVVPRRVKWLSTAMMGSSAMSMPALTPANWLPLAGVAVACIVAVLVWLWRHPERRPQAPLA
jgi:uncharacterized membrane protein YbaN (DUF454 family)